MFKSNWMKISIFFLLGTALFAQNYRIIRPTDTNNKGTWVDRLFDDHTMVKLERAIKKTAQKQMLYSYNIANASTPKFKPVLLEEDVAQLQGIMVQSDDQLLSQVFIEHMMAKMGENNKKQQALYAIFKKQTENMRKIASGGKQ